ncbi:DUF2905 domain-containing protein [Microbulbifer sp. SA54]|uniref:DUF2905 domain-containing protein n=1 Tax=Microbulbifer sp. SA54 TaxID=3401577 RepID=UPI003AAD084B
MSRWLIVAGCLMVLIGVALQYAPWLVNWFGRLPGDIHIETERSRVYFPITTMIVVSVLLSLIISFFRR